MGFGIRDRIERRRLRRRPRLLPESLRYQRGALPLGSFVSVRHESGRHAVGTVTWVGLIDAAGGFPFWLGEYPALAFDSACITSIDGREVRP